MSLLTTFLWTLLITTCYGAEIQMFCKCFCGSNSTIFELPMTSLRPCSVCTKQYCLDNMQDGLCDGIADATCPSNDFKTECFARDSFKDEMIVRSFLLITSGLIVYSIIKPLLKDKWQKYVSR
ncbi:hypothetical protein RMCBS344292_06648 [Rhizopus microsporus]|uniref:Membrane anchor Opy2 N-terminal domain-containing protein n=1 Tax=Rhizopus microsporus TaxID=58291 RepID=A0A0A1MZ80_RHIZD|nr:hypothetical protein BCV71DRAFT_211672 [Rhizopus microsporus]CEI92387.1 hypothetical protein RMCBS344292_06648 [Rhizopus microsporus]